ncbi:MAG: acyl-CoA/acyl-ACP dehydrogenase [Deltaproteobacteria bacterium]|nr:MAG: acyl-CoA/acyl-ACP dehydrogenase [Deltaproteobacteria bacterium]
MQIHGDHNYELEYSINRSYRVIKIAEIEGETREIRRLITVNELIKG